MADQLDVQVTGRSKFEIAHLMAINILQAEGKGLKDRKLYFNAVAEAMEALSGIRLK
jgi:hypothetical protein